jgi:hypothetical protein
MLFKLYSFITFVGFFWSIYKTYTEKIYFYPMMMNLFNDKLCNFFLMNLLVYLFTGSEYLLIDYIFGELREIERSVI